MKAGNLKKKIAYILAFALIFTSAQVGNFAYADENLETKTLDASEILDLSGNIAKKIKYIPYDRVSAAIEEGEAYILYDPASKELTLKNIYYNCANIILPEGDVTVNLIGKNMVFNQLGGGKSVFKQGTMNIGEKFKEYEDDPKSYISNTTSNIKENSGIKFTGEGSLNIFHKNADSVASIVTDGYLTVEAGHIYSKSSEVFSFEEQRFGIGQGKTYDATFFIDCGKYNQNGGDVVINGQMEKALRTFGLTMTNGKLITTAQSPQIEVYGDLTVTGGEFKPSFKDGHILVMGDVKKYSVNDGLMVSKLNLSQSSQSPKTVEELPKHLYTLYGKPEMATYNENGEKEFIIDADGIILLGYAESAFVTLARGNNAALNIENNQSVSCNLYADFTAVGGSKEVIPIDKVVAQNTPIVNNGKFLIQVGNFEKADLDTKVKEIATYLKMQGSGIIEVATANNTGKSYYYTNDGTPKNTVVNSSNLDFTTNQGNMQDTGVSWDNAATGYTLTLTNIYLKDTQTIKIPTDKKVTIRLNGTSQMEGGIESDGPYKLNLEITGNGTLIVKTLPTGGVEEDTITIAGGAKVYAKGAISAGASGGVDGILNVKGNGTYFDIDARSLPDRKTTIFRDINVKDGAEINIHSDKTSAYVGATETATQASINVTNGSKLKVACKYGVYVFNGKLTVDGSSTLETDATSAGIVVVDETKAKTQDQVLSLPGIPSGTKITFADNANARFWTIAKNDATVGIEGTAVDPADNITGALGKLVIKKETPGGGKSKKDDAKPDDSKKDDEEFEDVHKDDWFYDGVKDVVKKGYMQGISRRKFAPYMSTSRAMINQIVYNLDGKPQSVGKHDFTDVPQNAWYVQSLNYTFDKGVVVGFPDKTFRGDTTITREQLALILYRYAKYKGYDLNTEADVSKYKDFKNAGNWSQTSIKWAIKHNVMKGRSNATLAPTATLTRAELATILKNFDSQFVK